MDLAKRKNTHFKTVFTYTVLYSSVELTFLKGKGWGIFCWVSYHFSILYIHSLFLLWNNRIFTKMIELVLSWIDKGLKSKEPQLFFHLLRIQSGNRRSAQTYAFPPFLKAWSLSLQKGGKAFGNFDIHPSSPPTLAPTLVPFKPVNTSIEPVA